MAGGIAPPQGRAESLDEDLHCLNDSLPSGRCRGPELTADPRKTACVRTQSAYESVESGTFSFTLDESTDPAAVPPFGSAADPAFPGSASSTGAAGAGSLRHRQEIDEIVHRYPIVNYVAEAGETGRVLFVSPHITELLGYQPEEWTGNPGIWYRSVHPDDLEHFSAVESEAPTGSFNTTAAEYRIRTKTGEYVWVVDQGVLVPGENGRPDSWNGAMVGISEARQAEVAAADRSRQQQMTARFGEMASESSDEQSLSKLLADSLIGGEDIVEVEIWELLEGSKLHLHYHSNPSGAPTEIDYEPDLFPGSEISQGRTAIVADWSTDTRMAPYRRYPNPHIASSALVPIDGVHGLFGVLVVHASVPDRFSRNEENFLRTSANLWAGAIERRRMEGSLEHRLLFDPLTELPNRAFLELRLDEAISDAERCGGTMACIFLDIDSFKQINDGMGHDFGDATLKEMAGRLLEIVGPEDTVARYGGDSFCLVLRSIESAADARRVAEVIQESARRPIRSEHHEIAITLSIGVATFGPDSAPGSDARSLIREADAATHQAEVHGRDQIEFFDQPLRERALGRLETESGLRRALEEDELVSHYQPVTRAAEGSLAGFEALVRWQHPERGLLSPGEFIPIAEESGLVGLVDNWMLANAIAQATKWDSELPSDQSFSVAVNLSARRVSDLQFPAFVRRLLETHGLPPERLTLEVTESTLISMMDRAVQVLQELSDMGIRLALDDFGTGFSSLSYLSHLPLDVIKIDRSFVEDLEGEGSAGREITDAIIRMGKALSTEIVAEGVSSESQMEVIQQLGCDYIQGFLISRPVPAEQATALLEESLAQS